MCIVGAGGGCSISACNDEAQAPETAWQPPHGALQALLHRREGALPESDYSQMVSSPVCRKSPDHHLLISFVQCSGSLTAPWWHVKSTCSLRTPETQRSRPTVCCAAIGGSPNRSAATISAEYGQHQTAWRTPSCHQYCAVASALKHGQHGTKQSQQRQLPSRATEQQEQQGPTLRRIR